MLFKDKPKLVDTLFKVEIIYPGKGWVEIKSDVRIATLIKSRRALLYPTLLWRRLCRSWARPE